MLRNADILDKLLSLLLVVWMVSQQILEVFFNDNALHRLKYGFTSLIKIGPIARWMHMFC